MKKSGKGNLREYAKGLFLSLLAACLLSVLLPGRTVFADLLIELDDSFWEKHQRECSHVSRQYTANSPEGYVILWKSPESSKQNEVVLNGTSLGGDWQYTDKSGEVWCAVRGGAGKNGKDGVRGWLKTSECLVTPDHISFREAFAQEFVAYDPAYDHAFDGVDKVKLWSYPCSGVVVAEQIDARWLQDAESPGQLLDTCWRDPKGRMWGYIGYCYGIRNSWICLDDPAGETLGTDEDLLTQSMTIYPPADPDATEPEVNGSEETKPGAQDPGKTDSEEVNPEEVNPEDIRPQEVVIYPPAEHPPKVKNGVTGLTIAGVAGVVAVTVGMIWLFFMRKKK